MFVIKVKPPGDSLAGFVDQESVSSQQFTRPRSRTNEQTTAEKTAGKIISTSDMTAPAKPPKRIICEHNLSHESQESVKKNPIHVFFRRSCRVECGKCLDFVLMWPAPSSGRKVHFLET